MKYLLFSALYAPHVGGVESYTEGLANELAAQGNRVSIVTSRLSTSDLARESPRKGVTIVRVPCHPLMEGRLPLPARDRVYRTIMSQLAAEGHDRVIINTRFYGHSLDGARFAAKNSIPAVIIEHGSAHLSLGSPRADAAIEAYEHHVTKRIKKFGFPFCAVSQASAQWLSHFDIACSGIVANTIDFDAFANQRSARDFRSELGLSGDDFVVCSIGRLNPEKGVEAIIEAAASPIGKQATFLFAGTGPLESRVNEGPANAIALGSLSKPDVAALLSASNALCLPSRSEGFATALLEAAAMQTTPLVTNVGGVAELGIADERGYLLADRSAEAIEVALEHAIGNRTECSSRGKRLHDHALSCCGWNKSVEALERAFERAGA